MTDGAIPVLDLDELTPALLVAALQRCACVLLTGHDVPVASAQAVYRTGRDFMALPEADKQAVSWSGRGAWQGWQRMQGDDPAGSSATYLDLVERFELRLPQGCAADPGDAAALASWGDGFGLWPSAPPGFRAVWTEAYAVMHRLASRLVGLVADGLGIAPAARDDWTTRQWSNLVLNHYPPQHRPPPEGRVRSRPHTDIGGFTLLWTNDDSGGLEARGSDGTWSKVTIPSGAILVQAGDLLTRWTQGRIPSNLHRVVNPAPDSAAARQGRFSVVYFHHPDMDTTITGEDGHALLASEHVRRRQRLETPVLA